VKVEANLFWGLVVFNAVVAVVYGYLSAWEPVGTTALALSAGLALMVAFYLSFVGNRLGPRPEDRLDGEIHEAAGEIGFFSPHSVWPLPLAASFSLVLMGLIFGWWIVMVGTALLLLSVTGFVFEYHRSGNANH
jgi:hypothetical protein